VDNVQKQIIWIRFVFLNFTFLCSVKTDIQPGGAMSSLYIANANKQDSGNYTCSLADVASTTIAVHVLNGEIQINLYLSV
jgi:hypothetical protein